MVKFLHTADWHLGIRFAQLGPKADIAREIRIETAENLLKKAKELNVDFVLISGDLFDSNEVDRSVLNRVVQSMLNAAPLDIYILPGNHDPLTLDSKYSDPLWDSLSNVHIFKDPEPLNEINTGAILYPCPITQKQSKKDFTEWIDADRSEISIGVAHGNLDIEGFIDVANFPIDPDRAFNSNLNYLALGEWHSLFQHRDRDGQIRTVYPGTPETTKFGENESGKAVVVKIDNPNQPPNIEAVQIGRLNWIKKEERIYTPEEFQSFQSNLNNITHPDESILNIVLKGVVNQEIQNQLESMKSDASNFMYLNLDMDELYVKPNSLEFKAMLPDGSILSQTFDALLALMKFHPKLQEYSELSPEQADMIFQDVKNYPSISQASPEVLQRAIFILYQMTREVSK